MIAVSAPLAKTSPFQVTITTNAGDTIVRYHERDGFDGSQRFANVCSYARPSEQPQANINKFEFRTPFTSLGFSSATALTKRLKNEAIELERLSDTAGAIEKLREIADIWHDIATGGRFNYFPQLRAAAREAADTYIAKATALKKP